ncbi:P-selectin-like [Lytechinus variegatus]|uniref:P-selectin-like n=1 Tax=Lytechinus variegatus TaxID=7654 RepID=UPI001BB0E7CD|nr:P-selectin-like [Lytechinus variegatus]
MPFGLEYTTDPTFTYCPGNLGNKYTTGTSRSVSWGTPTATDNSGSVTVSRVSGQSSGSSFFVSSNQYTIQYRASDSAGNSANCYITFMVIGVRCSTLSAPSHGSVGCTNTNFISSVCTISCDLGYHVVGSKIRTCTQSGNTGYWDGSTTTCSRKICACVCVFK